MPRSIWDWDGDGRSLDTLTTLVGAGIGGGVGTYLGTAVGAGLGPVGAVVGGGVGGGVGGVAGAYAGDVAGDALSDWYHEDDPVCYEEEDGELWCEPPPKPEPEYYDEED